MLTAARPQGRAGPDAPGPFCHLQPRPAVYFFDDRYASMNESQLSEYCRSKGLYPEQIKRWREACVQGAQQAGTEERQGKREAKRDRKRIKQLERELERKEKALAEAAALLVVRKKLNALWGESEED